MTDPNSVISVNRVGRSCLFFSSGVGSLVRVAFLALSRSISFLTHQCPVLGTFFASMLSLDTFLHLENLLNTGINKEDYGCKVTH